MGYISKAIWNDPINEKCLIVKAQLTGTKGTQRPQTSNATSTRTPQPL